MVLLINYTRKQFLLALCILIFLDCYFNISSYYKAFYDTINAKVQPTTESGVVEGTTYGEEEALDYPTTQDDWKPYEYPLINSTEIPMEYGDEYNSSYHWFMAMKDMFKMIGSEDTPKYTSDMEICQVNTSALGPIKVDKYKLRLKWVEEKHPYVKRGGCYAPAHCRPTHRVAIIIPYRDRRQNLIILLHYLHPLLKKQLLDYRIFVVEQFGKEKFNKGTLYNIAFLETQRFGSWDCLIFHDVDLIPEDERIPYSCQENPTHMAAAVESFKYILPYKGIFGGVTSLTSAQYEDANGYSNFYWNWGGEDDDMRGRIQARNYTISRYNLTIARYATLPHVWNECGKERVLFLLISRLRYREEGLLTTHYKLINISEKKLYTHILADVNPMKIKLDSKSLMQHIISLHGRTIEYSRQDLQLKSLSIRGMKCIPRVLPSHKRG